jgi:hypothetical protein
MIVAAAVTFDDKQPKGPGKNQIIKENYAWNV